MPEGKIIKALSGFYYVSCGEKIYQCRPRGVFRKNKLSPLVGDEVVFQIENMNEGYILEVLKRKNELIRPPIANVDQAILVFSAAEPNFSTALLDRFLVLIESKKIEPLICISKVDLVEGNEMELIHMYAENYQKIGYTIVLTSTPLEMGIDELHPFLQNNISVFAGQSGVGKSTLLNALNKELDLKTNQISTHLGRGKHTTRHVELIQIGNGLVADTPGFSSLELSDIQAEELTLFFPELKEASELCKYRGCTHISEPKCAVKERVDIGVIPNYRYEHYVDFLQEIKDRKPRYPR